MGPAAPNAGAGWLPDFIRASCLSLLSNAVVAWNIGAMTKLVEYLRARRETVRDEDLAHVWPLPFRHVTAVGHVPFQAAFEPGAVATTVSEWA